MRLGHLTGESANLYNGRLKVWQFLLKILMMNNFAPYIRWTGNGLEFQIMHGQVVFTEWRMYKKEGEELTTIKDGDPQLRWRNVLIDSELVKNNLKGIKHVGTNGIQLIKKREGMNGGYYFADIDKVCEFLGITSGQLTDHIATVAQGQPYPDVRIPAPSNNRIHNPEATFRPVHDPYACLRTIESIPIDSTVADTFHQHGTEHACSALEANNYPGQAFPEPGPTITRYAYEDPNLPSTSRNWPTISAAQQTVSSTATDVAFSQEEPTSESYVEYYLNTGSIASHTPCNSVASIPPSSIDRQAQYHEDAAPQVVAAPEDTTVSLNQPMVNATEMPETANALSDADAIDALAKQLKEDWDHKQSASRNSKF